MWTLTEGGPYYVEVGRNIDVKYVSRGNVTIRTNNSNSTSSYVEE